MERKDFIGYIGKSAGLILVSHHLPILTSLTDSDKAISGTVTSTARACTMWW